MKKILNIFASISLVTTGASSVVACGSNPNPPNPPKSKIQKLYEELNGKTFTIQDNNFWGNESTYKQDLLADLEQAAHIKLQEDKNLLSLNSDLKTLDQPGDYTFNVNIGTGQDEKNATVKIDWKLTSAQETSPGNLDLFDFYTKTWPQDFQNYEQIYDVGDVSQITKLLLTVWDKTTKNWPKDLKTSIAWSEFTHDLLNQVFLATSGYFLIPSELQQYFHIQSDVNINSLNVNQYKQVKNPFYLQKNADDPKIFLPNYDYSQYTPFSPQKGLPKANQNWTVGYNTDYNLIQKEFPKTTWYIRKLDLNPKTTESSDPHNTGMIIDRLRESKYSSLTDDLTFNGNIKTDGTPSLIKVYYKKVDQDFTINVVAL